MLKNYITIIFRQLRKNKDFSLINVIGLAVGMSACLIISQLVYYHWTFDDYHQKKDRIYRVTADVIAKGESSDDSNTISAQLGQALAHESTEVQHVARFWNLNYLNNAIQAQVNGVLVMVDQPAVYGADKATFEIFDLPIIAGSTDKFDEPNKIILDKSSAMAIFSNLPQAIGNSISLLGNSGEQKYELIAIMDDLPENTHLGFKCLVSQTSIDKYTQDRKSWVNNSFLTYVLVKEDFDKNKLLSELTALHEKNAAKKLSSYGYQFSYDLMPLTDIHLHSNGSLDFTSPVQYHVIIGLAIIALVILIIAWINYLNLSLVKTLDRLKEVGIRKSLGSNKNQIVQLFIMEAAILNIIAFLLALTLSQITSPFLEQVTGYQFDLFKQVEITLILFGIVMIGTLIIGFYPSIMTNSVTITQTLLGNSTRKMGSVGMRKILVATQFVVTFLLVATTITVYKQIHFMKTAELGFNINDVMVIKSPPGDINANERKDIISFNAFKTEVAKQSGVSMVTNAGEMPGEPIAWGTSIRLESQAEDNSIYTKLVSMGLGFTDFLELKTVAGRPLQQGDDPWEGGDVVINEKLAQILGFEKAEQAIGAKLQGFYAPLQVRGVLENHHHTSLHYDYEPIAYILSSWSEYYFIRFDISSSLTHDERERTFSNLITGINKEWNNVFEVPMDYFFLDEKFNRQYDADDRFSQIFTLFSGLAIIIACLGLYGLTSFTVKQRTKEIGIRKVLGAGIRDLVYLLSKNYISIILVAYIIALPLAWSLLSQWLENYTFHIALNWWLLVVPLGLILFISALTISSGLRNAVRKNPVDSLRYE